MVIATPFSLAIVVSGPRLTPSSSAVRPAPLCFPSAHHLCLDQEWNGEYALAGVTEIRGTVTLRNAKVSFADSVQVTGVLKQDMSSVMTGPVLMSIRPFDSHA